MFEILLSIAIIIGFGFAVHYIDSAYEDYKEYIETEHKYDDR